MTKKHVSLGSRRGSVSCFIESRLPGLEGPRVPDLPCQRLGKGAAQQGAGWGDEGERQQRPQQPASLLSPAVTAWLRGGRTAAAPGPSSRSSAGPSWKGQGGSGCFCGSAGPGGGDALPTDDRLVPEAWGPAVTPAMGGGATGHGHPDAGSQDGV